MFKEILFILILVHILGDFYFQSDRMAEEKNNHYSVLLKHSAVYLLTSVLICIPVFSVELMIATTGLSLAHYAIDSSKYMYIRKKGQNGNDDQKMTKTRKRLIFIIDQLLHIFCIIVVCIVFALKGHQIILIPFLNSIFQAVAISPYVCLRWTVLLLLMWKPINISIKHLLLPFRPDVDKSENNTESNKDLRAGAYIGGLERIVMLVLLSVQQYSAIGLVLTAKSIARYSKIQEDKEFAEYYLLGTLLSVLFAVFIFLMV